MFYGTHEHNVDKKGRITIPSKFRDRTPSGVLIVTLGLDGNLMAFTAEAFDAFMQSLGVQSITNQKHAIFLRNIAGKSAELTYDSAGRILIPPSLRKEAKIEEEVVIVGSAFYFEIWAKDQLTKHEEEHDDPEAQTNAWEALDVPIRGI